MPRKSTADVMFALRMLMEKYREQELSLAFMDLEKACVRLLREELWFCIGEPGMAEKQVKLMQDMCESSLTVVRGL